ncbi:MAG: DnaJ domain-containing protein [Myxococcales bacterium]|nr:DnaJ domain-containing protein [Myxococcales bacterium]
MENKRVSGGVPQLGRIQLKRVRVERTSAPNEAAPPPAMPLRRRAMVVESDQPVRDAVAACLPDDVFETYVFSDADEALENFEEHGAALAIIGRELSGGTPGNAFCRMIRRSGKGSTTGIVLMSPAYRDVQLAAQDCSFYGADAFLALPAQTEALIAQVQLAVSRREPVERLGVLPSELARRIDSLFDALETIDYYRLLEVEPQADIDAIKKAYHRLALWLHPDRHARLKASHPHAFEKINAIFKRISEGYNVLVDDNRRRSYNLGLRKRGALRLSGDRQSSREERELALCKTDDARAHVLESLEARSLGDMEMAEEAMARALETEPDNEALALILDSIRKLLDVVNRGR